MNSPSDAAARRILLDPTNETRPSIALRFKNRYFLILFNVNDFGHEQNCQDYNEW